MINIYTYNTLLSKHINILNFNNYKRSQIQKLDKQINKHLGLKKSFNRLVIDIYMIDNLSNFLDANEGINTFYCPRGAYISFHFRA